MTRRESTAAPPPDTKERDDTDDALDESDDADDLYENAEGTRVEYDDLSDGEREYYDQEIHGISIAEFVRNWERAQGTDRSTDENPPWDD